MRAKLTLWIMLASLMMRLAVRQARVLYHSPHITCGERWALRIALVLLCIPMPGQLDEFVALGIVVSVIHRVRRRKGGLISA